MSNQRSIPQELTLEKKGSAFCDFSSMSSFAAVVITAAAMFTASVILAVMMVVVVTFGIGIIGKVPCNKALDCLVCISVDTAIERNA